MMAPQDAHLTHLIETFNTAGCRYVAQSLAEAVNSTLSAEGSAACEIAETAAAKADWDAAELALTDYQSRLRSFYSGAHFPSACTSLSSRASRSPPRPGYRSSVGRILA